MSNLSFSKCLKPIFSLAKSCRTCSTKKPVKVGKITETSDENKSKKAVNVTKLLNPKQEHKLDEVVNEEEICVVTEKERDASIKSKLSRECNKLHNKKIFLTATGLSVNLFVDSNKSTLDDLILEKSSKKSPKEAPPKPQTISLPTPNDASPASSTRRVRGEPGEVLYACVPIEWFKFFEPKTGVTGFYTFIFTFTTFLVSKEWYVLEHNYYGGLSMFILVWACIKYIGPHLVIYLDQEVIDYENSWKKGRKQAVEVLEEQIHDELLVQFQAEGQQMLMDAKRENVQLQLEEDFRKRQMHVYEEVKKKLDYQVEVEEVRQRIHHKNLVEYVHNAVMKSITPDMHDKLINYSLDNILAELNKGDTKL